MRLIAINRCPSLLCTYYLELLLVILETWVLWLLCWMFNSLIQDMPAIYPE